MNRTVVPGLVSIVVASYNHEGFLRSRMDSLIKQSYREIEIIVIDDDSDDNSVDVLREYVNEANVSLVCREDNAGWAVVSNQGLEIAKGEYILFANCDDSCDPEMIEHLVQAIQKNGNNGIAFCRSNIIDETDEILGDDFSVRSAEFRSLCSKDVVIPAARARRLLLHSCFIPNLSACLIKRRCFDDHGSFSTVYKVCCDWDLFFRIAMSYDIAYVSSPMNNFRRHRNSIRSATKEKYLVDEYLRLLLSKLSSMDLNMMERMSTRTHVMYIWATHIFAPSVTGLVNFPYQLVRVIGYDPIALVFIVPGFFLRISEVALKYIRKPLLNRKLGMPN